MSRDKMLMLFSGMVAILLTFSYAGSFAWSATVGGEDEIPPAVSVGGTDISGMEAEKASELLEMKADEWSSRSSIHLYTGSGTLDIPASLFDFQIEETMEQISSSGQYEWRVVFDDEFSKNVTGKLPERLKSHFQMERFKDEVEAGVSGLPEHVPEYNAYSFVPDNTEELYEEVASYSISLNETEGAETLVNQIGSFRVPGKTTVSLLDQTENVADTVGRRALNQIATVMYGSVLETPFVTEERHISLRLPDYADLGKEAAVDVGNKEDLRFLNTTSMAYYVHLELDGANLEAVWRGYPFMKKARTVVSSAEEVEPRKTIRYSTSVSPGGEVLIEEGKTGRTVQVYKEQSGKEERQLLTEDYYPPIDTVVERYPVSLLESDENSNGTGSGAEEDFDSSPPLTGENKEESEEGSSNNRKSEKETEKSGNDRRTGESGSEEEADSTEGESSPPSLWEPGNEKK
ncbi:VanW family protein [Salimicrobium sp. PL1-032A]|uniref:VanW family protein n=1 Tax=Salimicrobium sp. PL1-032A TaxID=3095364 RepID=UPI003261517D